MGSLLLMGHFKFHSSEGSPTCPVKHGEYSCTNYRGAKPWVNFYIKIISVNCYSCTFQIISFEALTVLTRQRF